MSRFESTTGRGAVYDGSKANYDEILEHTKEIN